MQIKEKCNCHGRQYAVTLQSLSVIRYAFSPCGMTTYGQVDARFLGLQYILATRRAEIVHIHDYLRPFPSYRTGYGHRWDAPCSARA
jgi:hypothetical protein